MEMGNQIYKSISFQDFLEGVEVFTFVVLVLKGYQVLLITSFFSFSRPDKANFFPYACIVPLLIVKVEKNLHAVRGPHKTDKNGIFFLLLSWCFGVKNSLNFPSGKYYI